MYFHTIPYFHQCFCHISLLGRKAVGYLPEAVPYQLPYGDMPVTDYVRIIYNVKVFTN